MTNHVTLDRVITVLDCIKRQYSLLVQVNLHHIPKRLRCVSLEAISRYAMWTGDTWTTRFNREHLAASEFILDILKLIRHEKVNRYCQVDVDFIWMIVASRGLTKLSTVAWKPTRRNYVFSAIQTSIQKHISGKISTRTYLPISFWTTPFERESRVFPRNLGPVWI